MTADASADSRLRRDRFDGLESTGFQPDMPIRSASRTPPRPSDLFHFHLNAADPLRNDIVDGGANNAEQEAH
jgi:hypothetical protein